MDRATTPAAALNLGSLYDLLGFHLRLAQLTLYRDFTATVADTDMTQKQFAVLAIVAANNGPSQVDIASLLGMDRATMLALIDRLQARRLIERRRSKGDKRRQELHLTPAGKKLVVKVSARIARHDARFTDRFTPTALRKLMDGLTRIHGQR